MKFILALGFFCFSFLHAENFEIKHLRFAHTWNDNGGGTRCLRMEVLEDALVHFELFERREKDHASKCLRKEDNIWISPMVDGKNGAGKYFDPKRENRYETQYAAKYTGVDANGYHEFADGFETSKLRVKVYNDSRCVSIFDKEKGVDLAALCGEDLSKDDKFIRVDKKAMTHFYGLGNLFTRGKGTDGDWKGIVWDTPKKNGTPGNIRVPNFYDGNPSASQFPMIYALGKGYLNYGLFFDHPYRMTMNFTENERYTYETYGDEIRFFFFGGTSLKDLRTRFMGLTGKPPVPPKSQFGHWTSKFGFRDWKEARDEVVSLRNDGFPLDGVALDLQWFGGEFGNPEVFRFGVLQFSDKGFPEAEKNLAKFYKDYGVHFMPIEESYIDSRLDEHRALSDADFRNSTEGFKGIDPDMGCYLSRVNLDFDKDNGGWKPALIDVNFKSTLNPEEKVWWGKGGMIDHSNVHARFFWHQLKRRWLSAMGIYNHWFDLGEPEMFFEYGYYQGFPELYREKTEYDGKFKKNIVQKHGDIHNLYNLFWAMGAHEGYQNNANWLKPSLQKFYGKKYEDGPRHWTMSRAGTVGMQRYGGMWTGDTRGNFENFRGHLQSQLHMSLLGMDYYSADTGGFFHNKDGKDPKDDLDASLYRQWYATASLLDIPLRPHGWADKDREISYAANVRGHKDSNRANAWRRYELIPYLYSLAHRAHQFAEPMFPPLVYYYQDDQAIREDGTEKMIGSSLLFRVVAEYKPEIVRVPVYLPKGKWFDYESLELFDSNGGITKNIDLFRRERVPASDPKSTYYFMNPLFAKEGAIIPKMYVDKNTMNALGKRWGEKDRTDEMIARVFASPNATQFILYEDDGVSRSYLNNQVRETVIWQKLENAKATVVIGKAKGSYYEAPDERSNQIELVVSHRTVKEVTIDGVSLARCTAEQIPNFDHGSAACWYQPQNSLIKARTGRITVDKTKTLEFVFE